MTSNAGKIYEQGILEPFTGETLRPGGVSLTREALQFCRFSPQAKLLDVGCGTGATLQFLRDEYGLDAVGLDLSERMLENAKKRSPQLPLIKGSGDNLPFRSGEMDGIFMECTFSIIEDSNSVLTECSRVLNNKGKLIISDFYYKNRQSFQTREYYMELLKDHGFTVQMWDDKSSCLVQLVADGIMKGLCADTLWQCILNHGENKGLTIKQIKQFKPGYFLMVAGKSSGRHSIGGGEDV